MTTISQNPFESSVLIGADALFAPAPAQAKASQIIPKEEPASLWRACLFEDEEDRAHRHFVRSFFAVAAGLCAGTVAYASWEAYNLLAGNHLQDAIARLLH